MIQIFLVARNNAKAVCSGNPRDPDVSKELSFFYFFGRVLSSLHYDQDQRPLFAKVAYPDLTLESQGRLSGLSTLGKMRANNRVPVLCASPRQVPGPDSPRLGLRGPRRLISARETLFRKAGCPAIPANLESCTYHLSSSQSAFDLFLSKRLLDIGNGCASQSLGYLIRRSSLKYFGFVQPRLLRCRPDYTIP